MGAPPDSPTDDPDDGEDVPPPGWYRYEEMADTLGYWDGEDWTEDYAPATGVVPTDSGERVGAAGWYRHPGMANAVGYWDGDDGTEDYAPARTGSADMPTGGPVESNILWLGYLTAFFIPLVGFFVGLTQINRSRHGVYIILVSLLLPILIGAYFLRALFLSAIE